MSSLCLLIFTYLDSVPQEHIVLSSFLMELIFKTLYCLQDVYVCQAHVGRVVSLFHCKLSGQFKSPLSHG